MVLIESELNTKHNPPTPLNPAPMFLSLPLLGDTNKQQIISILRNLGEILFAFDLCNGD